MITKDLINTVREEIAQKIKDNSTLFEVVSAFPVSTLKGYPAVIVMYNANQSAYASTGSIDSRRLLLEFSLNVYYIVQREESSEQAEKAIGEAVSELFRIFCQKKPLNSVELANISNTEWDVEEQDGVVLRTAQVVLSCSKWVEVQ